MTALPDWDIATDAQLAGAAAAGDRGAFAEIYDRYADRLHDFCIGMVRDREAAADCVQDVFCTAATQLPKLRDSEKLRPWLYAIARNEALRCIRERRREQAFDEMPEAVSGEAGPDTLAARTELADLIAEAAGGLSDRDRSVLELTYRHGLDGPELAEALGVSPGNATKMVFRLRETVERSLGALLVARRAHRNPRGCPELGGILADWDGKFSVLMRKRVARHIESCSTCEQERRSLVNPRALLGAVPVFIPAPWWLRGHTMGQIQLTAADFAMSGGATAARDHEAPIHHGGADDTDTPSRRTRRRMRMAAMAAAALLASFVLTLAWLHHQNVSISPEDLTATTPTPTAAPPPPTAATSNPAPLPPTGATSNPAPLPPPVGTNTAVPAVTVPPTQAPSLIQTPAPVTTQCPNGAMVPAGQSCPTPVTTQCPNGAMVPAGQSCPTPVTTPPPATVTCWDGSTAANASKCPPQVRSWRPSRSPSTRWLGEGPG
ncbi:MAG: sigma-70 family RNA polymerase sigma factor [Mycobacterium sp.]|uniref:RNA polymerase sigma factor n=1 Tax=Mycobacterium sp. TaxID=1785 RepID=UPI003BB0C299